MAHAPLAAIPAAAASAVVFPVGVAALAAIVWILRQLSRRDRTSLAGAAEFWVVAAAVALVSRFLIRDLLDGGENLIVTALVWSALWMWSIGRLTTGAGLLGGAIALKLTAAIFVFVLLVRCRYRAAALTMMFVAVFVALPAGWMGAASYREHMAWWSSAVASGIASGDPATGVLGPEPVRNLSLRAAVGRALVRAAAPAESRSAANRVALILLLAIAAVPLLWWRRSAAVENDLSAWAAGGVIAVLLSPITWRAHLVAILPACYLLVRYWFVHRRLDAAGIAGLAAIAVPGLVLTRGVLGEGISDWSDRWSITTGALICLLVGTAWPFRR